VADSYSYSYSDSDEDTVGQCEAERRKATVKLEAEPEHHNETNRKHKGDEEEHVKKESVKLEVKEEEHSETNHMHEADEEENNNKAHARLAAQQEPPDGDTCCQEGPDQRRSQRDDGKLHNERTNSANTEDGRSSAKRELTLDGSEARKATKLSLETLSHGHSSIETQTWNTIRDVWIVVGDKCISVEFNKVLAKACTDMHWLCMHVAMHPKEHQLQPGRAIEQIVQAFDDGILGGHVKNDYRQSVADIPRFHCFLYEEGLSRWVRGYKPCLHDVHESLRAFAVDQTGHPAQANGKPTTTDLKLRSTLNTFAFAGASDVRSTCFADINTSECNDRMRVRKTTGLTVTSLFSELQYARRTAPSRASNGVRLRDSHDIVDDLIQLICATSGTGPRVLLLLASQSGKCLQ